MTVINDAKTMQEDLVQLRRRLHQHPEVGLDLPRTQEAVLAALDGLPLEVTTGTTLSSVTAVLRGTRTAEGVAERTVLVRGDMDALPVRETTGLDYAASGDAMHACGHDLHTTMLVGAARLLAGRRESLAGDVVFMFQPGEEGYDGARHMVDEGVLGAAGSQVAAALALHVTSSFLPPGVFATRRGPVMSAADVLRVTVRGAGGHGSAPHRAKDPIPAACEMVTALQTMVTRRFDVFDPVVVTIGAFHAGTAHNVIPDEATFEATVRSFSVTAHSRILEQTVQICRGIAAAHGLEVDAVASELYPVTVNDGAEVDAFGATVRELHGAHRFAEMPNPLTGSEDFSRVLDAVPGTMAFLGTCLPERDPATAPYNHSPEAAFDDSLLADGAAVYAEWALQRLLA
jgi:hippurate hydrolase